MSRSVVARICGGVILAVCAAPAAAQDEGRIGLVFALPRAVGVQWDMFDRFGVRVDGSYDRHQSTFTIDYRRALPPPGSPVPPPQTTTSTRHLTTLSVSPLFTIGGARPLKIYVAPQVGVSINRGPARSAILSPGAGAVVGSITGGVVGSGSVEVGLGDPPTESERPELETHYRLETGALFGASYRLSDRFALFGEARLRVAGDERSRGATNLKSRSVGLGGAIGGILYF